MTRFRPSQLANCQPGLVGFGVLVAGFVTVALSFFWDLGSAKALFTTMDGEEVVKEVGYGSAFNWSLGLTLLLPASILYLCKTSQSLLQAVRTLAECRMVVTKDLRPVTSESLHSAWNQALDRRRTWLLVLFLLGAAFSLWEWWDTSGRPLAANRVEFAEEWDWSVGVLLDDEGKPKFGVVRDAEGRPDYGASLLDRLWNALVSLLAFLGQGLIIALILTFTYQMVVASAFFQRLSSPEGRFRLIPDPESQDLRRGFELLSEFLEHSLILVVFLYFQFYLSRLQNVYLRSDNESILSFVQEDLVQGLIDKPFDLGTAAEVVRVGTDPTDATFDYTSIMVSLAAFAVMMVAAFMIGSTVRDAARSSKRELLSLTNARPAEVAELTDLTPKEVHASLGTMVFWPVNYLKAGQFFGLVILGVFCIFFYKLGVVLLGLLLLRILWEVGRYIFGARSAEPS